jgi:hypothetical protein
VRLPITALDEVQAKAERSRAQSIEKRIQFWEKNITSRKLRRSMTEVEQPKKKQNRNRANSENGNKNGTRSSLGLLH